MIKQLLMFCLLKAPHAGPLAPYVYGRVWFPEIKKYFTYSILRFARDTYVSIICVVGGTTHAYLSENGLPLGFGRDTITCSQTSKYLHTATFVLFLIPSIYLSIYL